MVAKISAVALVAGLLAGCSLDIGDSPFKCNQGGYPLCPPGYECKFSQWCVKEGTCPSTLTQCGGGGTCGDGTCDPGEKTTCPKDCTSGDAGPAGDGYAQWDHSFFDVNGGPDQWQPTPDQWQPPPDLPQAGGTFGSKCVIGGAACNTGFKCIGIGTTSTTSGFCTKQCLGSGTTCTGQPMGTSAYCLLKDTSGIYYCAFLCKLSTQTWSCPSTLTCSPTANPVGSDQYPCLP